MTRTRRKTIFLLFLLAFAIIAPLVVLYANGDRLSSGWGILKTGGIYVAGAPLGSQVFVSGRLRDTTSFLSRDILIKNLRAGTYEVEIRKDGYPTWKKKVSLSGNLVAEAEVFILPKDIPTREITKTLSLFEKGATTTKNNNEYTDVMRLFTASTSKMVKTTATSSVDLKGNLGTELAPFVEDKIGLWKKGNEIFVQWFGREDAAPKYFCTETSCVHALRVITLPSSPRNIAFFPGNNHAVIIASDRFVYALQTEENPDKLPQVLYEGSAPTFVLSEGVLYVKDGSRLFEIGL